MTRVRAVSGAARSGGKYAPVAFVFLFGLSMGAAAANDPLSAVTFLQLVVLSVIAVPVAIVGLFVGVLAAESALSPGENA